MWFLILKIALFVLAVVAIGFGVFFISDSCGCDDEETKTGVACIIAGIGLIAIGILICLKVYFAAKIVLFIAAIIILCVALIGDDALGALFIAVVLGIASLLWFTNCFGLVKNESSEKTNKDKSAERLEKNVDNEARKQTKEKMEKELKSKDKEFQRLSEQDFADLNRLGSEKMELKDFLFQISEPKYFVIAPMSYSTEKFEDDNWSAKKKNQPSIRVALLETAINKFENYIDDMLGVSFLDRSKIAQIEKEHKFQLSDWSNDKKTAEVGRALNANVLLFLDKFYYIDNEYRFEAKFVDINTMQTISYMLAYSGNKLKEPKETLERINFRTFTKISSTENPFADEFPLLVASKFRMPQNRKIVFANKRNGCPLGYGKRIDFSEYDLNRPKTVLLDVSSITFDGAGSVELKFGENCKSGTYTFEPCDLYVEKIENDYYTDCKIGNLSIQTDSGYEKFDVYTINNREYYLRLGSAELPKVTVNYYLQMVKN